MTATTDAPFDRVAGLFRDIAATAELTVAGQGDGLDIDLGIGRLRLAPSAGGPVSTSRPRKPPSSGRFATR